MSVEGDADCAFSMRNGVKNGLRGEIAVKHFMDFVYADVEVTVYDETNTIVQTNIVRLLEHEYLHVSDNKLGELIDDTPLKISNRTLRGG